jgi:hypothetical protein
MKLSNNFYSKVIYYSFILFREAFKEYRISYSLSLVVLTPVKEILSNILELITFITF